MAASTAETKSPRLTPMSATDFITANMCKPQHDLKPSTNPKNLRTIQCSCRLSLPSWVVSVDQC
eukprot:3604625-Amphidinium_carterae.1